MVGGSIIAVKQATPRRKGDRAKRQDLAGDVAGGDEDLFTLCTPCIHQRPATTAFPSLRGTPRCPASDVTRLEAPFLPPPTSSPCHLHLPFHSHRRLSVMFVLLMS